MRAGGEAPLPARSDACRLRRSTTGPSASTTSSKGPALLRATRANRAWSSATIAARPLGYWKADEERPRGPKHTMPTKYGHNEKDVVECIVLLRKNEETLPALKDVKAKVAELNDPESRPLAPGHKGRVLLRPDRLLNITTETVTENLIMGVVLVVVVLFMFVNNIRTAIIVSINIPLALLFAFTVLYVRGKSANLLSIGAVDFGIIVDSSVIMVENIYRNLARATTLSWRSRSGSSSSCGRSTRTVVLDDDHGLCLHPALHDAGPEGELFGPMAQTYAFALAGALLLALTLTPVLSMFMFRHFQPTPENFLVRFLKRRYIWQLNVCLDHPYLTVVLMTCLIGYTATLIPSIGREFMPALEEGNLWIRATGPLNFSLERHKKISEQAEAIMATYPEVESIVVQLGRPDDATDTAGYENCEYFVPLRPKNNGQKSSRRPAGGGGSTARCGPARKRNSSRTWMRNSSARSPASCGTSRRTFATT